MTKKGTGRQTAKSCQVGRRYGETGNDSEYNINEKTDQHDGYAEKLKKYCLMDDVFFRAFIRRNKPAAELIFRIILQKNELEITEMETQRDMMNLIGRSAVFDFYGIVDGKPADLEIENSVEGADFHRARYHSSLLDADSLDPGQDFNDLPDTYVVFVTAADVVGCGDPYYLIERIIKGRNVDVKDGSHIIYVNGQYRADDEIGWLMHDFNCADPEQMHYDLLKEKTKYLKGTEEGAKTMYREMDELFKEGAESRAKEMAITMIQDGEPDSKIIRYTKLTKNQVEKLREKTKVGVMA